MPTEDANPYLPSGVDPHAEQPGGELQYRESLQYMQAVKYVFASPNWAMNLLFGGLCILSTQVIPFVGYVVWWGYQFEIVESLHCRPRQGYPDFSFNRFVDYLNRGLWILLAILVTMIAVVPIVLVLVFCVAGCLGGMIAVTGGDEETTVVLLLVLIPLMFLLIAVFTIVANLVMTPFILRAGLSQDFGETLNFWFARDFIGKMWKEIVVAALFFFVVMIVAEFIGLALLCIGVFPAIAYATLVQGHLWLQLYQVYLSKGGEKIPLKPQNPPAGQSPFV